MYHFSPLMTRSEGGCLPDRNEPPIFRVGKFASLRKEEKRLLVAGCAYGDVKYCVRNRSYDTHDMILIAEDALIKVSASLVLIANYGISGPRRTSHVFHVRSINVFQCKGLVRDGLPRASFLLPQQSSEPNPDLASVFVQTNSLTWEWHERTVNQQSSLADVTKEIAIKPTPTIERSIPVLHTVNTTNEP